MIRALHLLSHDTDLQSREGSRVLREAMVDSEWCEVASRTIGRGGKYANLVWAILGLRHEVAEYDLVHAWDEASLAAAAFAGATRIVFTAPPLLRSSTLPRLRWLMRFRDVRVICTTPTQHQALLARGVPADRCFVIRPAVQASRSSDGDRAEIRASLGIGEEDFVLLTPGESTRASNHELAVWTGSILHVTDERYRMLLWGHGRRLHNAEGLGRRLRQPRLVVVAERKMRRAAEFAELLPAADAMLATPSGPSPTLPVAMAMAAGVPVIAVPRPELGELVTDNVTALTVPTATARLLAQRVLDLRADESLRATLIANARSRAVERLPAEPFVLSYRTLYAQIAAGECISHAGSVKVTAAI